MKAKSPSFMGLELLAALVRGGEPFSEYTCFAGRFCGGNRTIEWPGTISVIGAFPAPTRTTGYTPRSGNLRSRPNRMIDDKVRAGVLRQTRATALCDRLDFEDWDDASSGGNDYRRGRVRFRAD